MKESINQKIMLALKTRNKIQLYVLRMIKAKFLEYETAKNAKELNESAEIQILKKMKSDWEKELGFLKEGQRDTSVIKSQLDVLNTYIPVVATKDEVMEALNNLKDVEISINGPKDSFNENIQVNLGLIKRRIKSKNLVNEDYFLGSVTKTKISILYLKNKVDKNDLEKLRNKINNILNKDILSHGDLKQYLNQNKKLMPTILESQRPDHASISLLQNKIVILVDNSPFCLILPSYLSDFINPIDDNYQKSTSINFIKVLRFFCFIFTLFAYFWQRLAFPL